MIASEGTSHPENQVWELGLSFFLHVSIADDDFLLSLGFNQSCHVWTHVWVWKIICMNVVHLFLPRCIPQQAKHRAVFLNESFLLDSCITFGVVFGANYNKDWLIIFLIQSYMWLEKFGSSFFNMVKFSLNERMQQRGRKTTKKSALFYFMYFWEPNLNVKNGLDAC